MQPHRRQPTRLRHPWDSPGKNTGMGCHFFLQCMKGKSESEVTQSCPTLCDPMDCSPPGSSVHGSFQARVLEWVAIIGILIIPSLYVCHYESILTFNKGAITGSSHYSPTISCVSFQNSTSSTDVERKKKQIMYLVWLKWSVLESRDRGRLWKYFKIKLQFSTHIDSKMYMHIYLKIVKV